MFRHIDEHSIVSSIAAEDLRFSMFRAVVQDQDGNIARAGLGADVYGVLINNPDRGEPADVAVGDFVEIVSGSAFVVGARLISDAAGRFVVASPSAPNETRTYYRAEQAATGPNEVVAARREVTDVRG